MKITMWGLLIDDDVYNDNCISMSVGMEAVQSFIHARHESFGWEAPVDNICDKVARIFNTKNSEVENKNRIERINRQIETKGKPKKTTNKRSKKGDPDQLSFNF